MPRSSNHCLYLSFGEDKGRPKNLNPTEAWPVKYLSRKTRFFICYCVIILSSSYVFISSGAMPTIVTIEMLHIMRGMTLILSMTCNSISFALSWSKWPRLARLCLDNVFSSMGVSRPHDVLVHNKMHWSPINSHCPAFSIMQWGLGINPPAHWDWFPYNSALIIIILLLCLLPLPASLPGVISKDKVVVALYNLGKRIWNLDDCRQSRSLLNLFCQALVPLQSLTPKLKPNLNKSLT